MNLRKLEHLLAVVENRSFRKAAEAVHLSQPALSRSLASLEQELGITLLDRSYGRIVPTAYAQPLVDHMRRIASESRALKESVRRLKGLEEGEIRIGFGPFAAATALGPVMREVVSHYPRLRVNIEIGNSGLLLELLRKDRLDIVIGDSRYLQDPEGITIQELRRQTIAIVAHHRHELILSGRALTLDDLRHQTTGAPTLPNELVAVIRDLGFDDFPTVTCDDMSVLVEMAQATSMVVLVPRLVVDSLPNRHSLAVLPIPVPFDPYTRPSIMYTAGRTLGPVGTLLTDLVGKWFGVGETTGEAMSEAAASGPPT